MDLIDNVSASERGRIPNSLHSLLLPLQTRSFQYIDDLIQGMVAVMDGDEIGPFNVGNPGEFTMLELANVSLMDCQLAHLLPIKHHAPALLLKSGEGCYWHLQRSPAQSKAAVLLCNKGVYACLFDLNPARQGGDQPQGTNHVSGEHSR